MYYREKSINIYISRIPINRRYADDKIKRRTDVALVKLRFTTGKRV